MRYAIVLAGIPGTIVNGVLADLRKRYPDNYVFRGTGARLRSSKGMLYRRSDVDDALNAALDAVFGTTKRPNGFCQNASRGCGLAHGKGVSCRKTNGHSCTLTKPDFLILIHQNGQCVSDLLNRFHHSALAMGLSISTYNNRNKTVAEILAKIEDARLSLGILRETMSSYRSPLFLPPINYNARPLMDLLRNAATEFNKGDVTQFKRTNFSRSRNAYISPKGLRFQPAEASGGRHGSSDAYSDPAIALTRFYRLGCPYADDFHFDLTREGNGKKLSDVTITCRQRGQFQPKSERINMLVDDCIR